MRVRSRGRRRPREAVAAAAVLAAFEAVRDDPVLLRSFLRALPTGAADHAADGDLLALSRQGLESAFLPGASLWPDGVRSAPVAACADSLGRAAPSPGCQEFLRGSRKAALQFDLETRLAAFHGA